MDDALAILDYLPLSYRNKDEERYVGFLWESFATNYENGKYEFANLAFHLLYMSYICFAVWRIRAARRASTGPASRYWRVRSSKRMRSCTTRSASASSTESSECSRPACSSSRPIQRPERIRRCSSARWQGEAPG